MKENKLKPFIEMVKLDLSKHTQKKPTFYKDKSGKMQKTSGDKWLDYIEWAKVLELLYENGASSVSFYSTIHKEKPNTLEIKLQIDNIEYTTDYPIIDGNSIINNANQMQIHKAELRGFVKCVAIHTGLGLSLWMKEERQLSDVVEESKPAPKKQLPLWNEANFEKAYNANATIEKIKQLYTLTPELEEKWIKYCFEKAEQDGAKK